MGYFKQQQQQTLLLILTLAFAIAITPALSVVGWDERHMPDPRVCWAQINKADGCEHEIYASLVKKKIKLSYACCDAVQGMSSKCKNWMFNHGRLSPEFGDQIKGYCATLGVTLPPSYRIYYPDKTPLVILDMEVKGFLSNCLRAEKYNQSCLTRKKKGLFVGSRDE